MTVLILDVDGVVITGHADGGRWDRNIQRDLGIAAERLQTEFFAPHWPKILVGESDMFEVLDGLWSRMAFTTSPRDFVDYWFAADSTIDAGVIALADEWRARGRKAFLGTNQERYRADHLWRSLGLAAHFDGMFYSAALGAQKPDALFFQRVQEKLPAQRPDEILFFDDISKNVETARTFGWRAHLYRNIADLHAVIGDEN